MPARSRYTADDKAAFFAWLIDNPTATINEGADRFGIPRPTARRLAANYPGPLPQRGRRGARGHRQKPNDQTNDHRKPRSPRGSRSRRSLRNSPDEPKDRQPAPHAPPPPAPPQPPPRSRVALHPRGARPTPRAAPPVLSGPQQTALEGLLEGFSCVEAAEYADVTIVELAQWLDDPTFQRGLQAAERLLAHQDERAFVALRPLAIAAHRELLTNRRLSARDQLRAIEMLYNRLPGYAPVQRIDQRVRGKVEHEHTAHVVVDVAGIETAQLRELTLIHDADAIDVTPEPANPTGASNAPTSPPAGQLLQLPPPSADPRHRSTQDPSEGTG